MIKKSKMKTVRKMNLQNNSLELIPDQIEKMASLRVLNIEGNFLRFYPKVQVLAFQKKKEF